MFLYYIDEFRLTPVKFLGPLDPRNQSDLNFDLAKMKMTQNIQYSCSKVIGSNNLICRFVARVYPVFPLEIRFISSRIHITFV